MTLDIYILCTFYQFADFPDCAKFQPRLKKFMQDNDIKGTVLVTPEGMNGTVSGTPANIEAFQTFLREDKRFNDLNFRHSVFTGHAFGKAKVKCKREVISLGLPVDAVNHVGDYVTADQWNDLITADDVIVVDTRNAYEVHLGTFKNAVNPKTKNFKELPKFLDENLAAQKNKRIAMFCTGGVRCEKSTAYLKERGFDKVYHLKGGILQYLEDVPEKQSLWEGSCYVFDERVALTHGLKPSGDSSICPGCGHSLFTKDRRKPDYVPGVCCAFCPPEKIKAASKPDQEGLVL
jgi:UPF0176 protein